MDFKYLHTFRTIVSEGSFSKAAQKLNYTQSTITFQISQLESELSAKLFEKIGRQMVLTKAGERLVPYVDDVLSSVDKICCFSNDLAEYRGDLHIGIGETLLCYQVPAVIKSFHEQAPHAKLFLRSMNCYDIRSSLLDGTLDLGILYEDIGGLNTNITTYQIETYPLTLVASPEIFRKYNDFITPNKHIHLPFIINESTCIFRQIFERYLQSKSIVLDYTIELWSIPTIINLVKNNMGISYLPEFSVQNELDTGELVPIPTDIPNSHITAVCAHHKNKWISPAMNKFIQLACI